MANWKIGYECNKCGNITGEDHDLIKHKICKKCGELLVKKSEKQAHTYNLVNATKVAYQKRLFKRPLVKEYKGD